MSTKATLEFLLAKKKIWTDLYDRCTECLNYLDQEFCGKKESDGSVSFRLRNMHTDLSGGGFWQGPDADSFGRRLKELDTEFCDSEEAFRLAIEKIQRKAEKETAGYNQRIRDCYANMDGAGKAALFAEAYWQTIKDLFT